LCRFDEEARKYSFSDNSSGDCEVNQGGSTATQPVLYRRAILRQQAAYADDKLVNGGVQPPLDQARCQSITT
jgi:hypothetical protein